METNNLRKLLIKFRPIASFCFFIMLFLFLCLYSYNLLGILSHLVEGSLVRLFYFRLIFIGVIISLIIATAYRKIANQDTFNLSLTLLAAISTFEIFIFLMTRFYYNIQLMSDLVFLLGIIVFQLVFLLSVIFLLVGQRNN